VPRLLGSSLLASVVFFLITNFGVWAGSPLYPPTAEGLAACYIAGIPFFWNTLLGDLFFTGALFGAFELLSRQVPALSSTRSS
ncbi:MAG: DUF6580 family putative transport protein, partial [Saprospiraceae bacterium]|nr:DUF6580 family putative transport protein [Saprospiraceae bacterium]